jgi:hypothetical protein
MWLLGLLCALVPALPVRAYEDQLSLSFGAGYAYAASSALPKSGALFDVAVSYGFAPEGAVRGRVSYALHPDSEPLHVGSVGLDVLYVIDVVSVVPYFGIGASGVGRARDGDFDPEAAVQLVAGLDYLVSRAFALELELRPQLLVTQLDDDPIYLGALVAAVWLIDL